MSGYLVSKSAKRSRVKTTEPLEEFSKGTTPLWAAPVWTAEKTSSMVISGERVWVSSLKTSRVAWRASLVYETMFVR
jgi:hypothetical protein